MKGDLCPVFREQGFSEIEHYIINEMHRGTVSFALDYCKTFQDGFMYASRSCEIALPFETFLHDIPEKDM